MLTHYGFWVDRKADLVNARLKRLSMEVTEEKLAMLGRLMGCSRQLDVTMTSEAKIDEYVHRFLTGDYSMGHLDPEEGTTPHDHGPTAAVRHQLLQRLKWNIVIFMLLVVLIPLPLVAGTLYNYYRTYVRTTVNNNLKGVVEKRREAIEVFLSERVLNLQTLAKARSLGELGQQAELEDLFSIVKALSGSFVDMGLIGSNGVQFAYVGRTTF